MSNKMLDDALRAFEEGYVKQLVAEQTRIEKACDEAEVAGELSGREVGVSAKRVDGKLVIELYYADTDPRELVYEPGSFDELLDNVVGR